jgi:hypothetical protein
VRPSRRQGEFSKRLRNRALAAAEIQEILENPDARRYHALRVLLAGHRNTPRREALSLVPTLFWRGLAQLSADARVHPEVRRAADRNLLRRLPEMALAERVDLARIAGRGTLLVLRFDRDPRILAAVLDNRFTTEPDVVVVAAHAQSVPATLELIAGHPRWSLSLAVRSALLRNPRLPVSLALALLTRATREDLKGLKDSAAASPLLKACAERVLAQRLGAR